MAKVFFVEVTGMSYLAKEAFKSIPSDRPILQFLVDKHCYSWQHCCEDTPDSLAELPRDFMLRVMRRLKEILEEAKHPASSAIRCYYEHVDDTEAAACGKSHMRYEEDKGYGVFGPKIRCENCISNGIEQTPKAVWLRKR